MLDFFFDRAARVIIGQRGFRNSAFPGDGHQSEEGAASDIATNPKIPENRKTHPLTGAGKWGTAAFALLKLADF